MKGARFPNFVSSLPPEKLTFLMKKTDLGQVRMYYKHVRLQYSVADWFVVYACAAMPMLTVFGS